MRVRQSGVSLIEAVVAVAILASGILGLAALQGRAMAMSHSVYYRSIAADLAADLAERIRLFRTPILSMDTSGVVDPAFTAAALLPPDFSRCVQNTSNRDSDPTCAAQDAGHTRYATGTVSVASEMALWNTALRTQLPNGRYTLQVAAPPAPPLLATGVSSPVGGFYRYTLTITWSDDRTSAASDFSYVTVIE